MRFQPKVAYRQLGPHRFAFISKLFPICELLPCYQYNALDGDQIHPFMVTVFFNVVWVCFLVFFL